jgi:hypothetical protein
MLYFSYNYGHLPNQAKLYEIWQQCNKIIAGANKLIPVMKKNQMNLVSLKRKSFLRAWSHFILVNIFGKAIYTFAVINPSTELGIPVVLTYDATAKPKRNTLKKKLLMLYCWI